MRHQRVTLELKSTTGVFASFILIALLGVSSTGIAQVDTWTRRADMPTGRNWLATAAVNGKIYAIGGFGRTAGASTVLSTVEAYAPVTDTWTPKADMPTARDSLSTIAIGGKIYAIGGVPDPRRLTVLSTVEVYDPTTDSWGTKADMPTRRFSPATAAVEGKIYVIGGVDFLETGRPKDLSAVEVYSPRTDTWERKADMPTPRSLANNAPVINGKIYVIGGGSRERELFRNLGLLLSKCMTRRPMPGSRERTCQRHGGLLVLAMWEGKST